MFGFGTKKEEEPATEQPTESAPSFPGEPEKKVVDVTFVEPAPPQAVVDPMLPIPRSDDDQPADYEFLTTNNGPFRSGPHELCLGPGKFVLGLVRTGDWLLEGRKLPHVRTRGDLRRLIAAISGEPATF